MGNTILSVKNLDVTFKTNAGKIHALRGINFDVPLGKTVALVGESGSGKSVTVKAVTGLLDENAEVNGGEIIYTPPTGEKYDILAMKKSELRKKINGQQIAMIFQDPMTSLDPTMTIGEQVAECLLFRRKASRQEAFERAKELLTQVGIDNAEKRLKNYPHQLSGGMRQRVVIAIALAFSPKVLICDEPTTALDVTIGARILDLIRTVQRKLNLSVVFITHDLGVVAKVADFVNVMYAGKIIESGTAEDIFYDPRHPYTWGLLAAMPSLGTKGEKLYSIPGSPPNLLREPAGDAFFPRNAYALNIDKKQEPPMFKISATHSAATWLLHENAPKVEMPAALRRRFKAKEEGD